MKYFALSFVFILATGLSIFGQSPDIPVSNVINATQLLRDVEILADDNMEGRKVGTPGGIKAREYLLKRFKEIGLDVYSLCARRFAPR